MNKESKSLIVAVDGGGSTCRVSICELSGEVIGTAVGGSANVTTDFDNAVANILDTTRRAYSAAGVSETRMGDDFAFLGLAGANRDGMAARTENALKFKRVKVTSDREIAVHGAMGHGDGTIAAIGTGSFFVSRKDEKVISIGGWGFQLSDDCGGALLGRKLLRQTVHAYDGVVAHSPLTRAILDRFGGSPQEMIEFVQAASPIDYGKFCPDLINAYNVGDTNAIEIVDSAIALLHHTLDVLNTQDTGVLYLLGGLGPVYKEWLKPEFRQLCAPPKGTATDGAIALAQRLWAGVSE